jgi:hypothetical protein
VANGKNRCRVKHRCRGSVESTKSVSGLWSSVFGLGLWSLVSGLALIFSLASWVLGF